MTRDQEIAGTILEQLGNGRLVAMTGAKNFIAIKNGVQFKIGRNSKGINLVKIVLNEMDTYNVEYSRFTKKRGEFIYVNNVKVKDLGIYNDMLQNSFETATGMYLTI